MTWHRIDSHPSFMKDQFDNAALETLPPDCAEVESVRALLKRTLPTAAITRVERVQNKAVWRRFRTERQILRELRGRSGSRWLWHGTGDTCPEEIATGYDGVDVRRVGGRRVMRLGANARRRARAACMGGVSTLRSLRRTRTAPLPM